MFIVGDLNCPCVDWQSNSSPLDGVQDKILECIDEFGLVQCVSSPTRGANILDLVLVNEPLLLSSLSVMDPVGNSDHDSVSDGRVVCQLYQCKATAVLTNLPSHCITHGIMPIMRDFHYICLRSIGKLYYRIT